MARVLFGVGSIAQLVYSFLCEEDGEDAVDCFTLNASYVKGNSTVLPAPLVAFEQLSRELSCPAGDIEIIICIGYNKMNTIRKNVFNMVLETGYSIGSYRHPSAVISREAVVGTGSIVFENVVIQPFATIGAGNILWSNATIAHHSKLGDFNFLAPSASIAGEALIGNDCFIGNNATIRNGISIGDSVLIGANCYVGADVEAKSVLLAPKPWRSERSSLDYETW